MTAENLAKFTINGDASVDPVTGDKKYQAAALDVLTLTLEQNPSTVLNVTYSVYDSSVDDSPLASKDAPLLTFTGSGTSSDSPATVNGTVELIMPAAAAHSWNVRCIVSHSDGPQEYVRQIDIPYVLAGIDIFKSVPGETDEFYARGWNDKFNDYMTYIAAFTVPTLDQSYDAGGAGLGRVVTVDSGAIEFNGSNAADYTLEVTNTANGGAIYCNNSGTGLTFDFRHSGVSKFSLDGNTDVLEANVLGLLRLITHTSMSLELNSSDANANMMSLSSVNFGAGTAGLRMTANDGIIVDSANAGVTIDGVGSSNFTITGNSANARIMSIGCTNAGAGVAEVDIYSDDETKIRSTAGLLIVSDGYQAGSTYGTDLVLSDASAEWDTFETNFGEVSILDAINQCASSAVTLDEAYNASAGASTITVDAGDVTWNEVGAYSFVVGLSGCTGAADGFFVEDGTDYFKLTHAAADTLGLDTALSSVSISASLTVDVDSAGDLAINSSGGVINIGNDAVAQKINVGTGAAARTISVGNAASTEIQLDALLVDINAGATGLTVDSGATADFDAVGAFSINSSTGVINVGDDAVAQNIYIGTAGARTIYIGHNAGTALNLGSVGTILARSAKAAADAIQLDATAGGIELDAVGVLELNSSAGVIGIGNDVVAQNINVGTGGARTIALGSATATAVTLDAVALSLDASEDSNISITTNSAAVETLTIAVANAGAESNKIDVSADGDISAESTGASVFLDANRGMYIECSAGSIFIGNDAVAQPISIGTGAAARTITIGNATGATAVDILSGTGGINLHDGVAQLDLDGAGAFTETALVSANITPSGALTLRGGGVSQFGDDTGYFAFGGTGVLSTSGITTTDIDCSGALSINSSAGVINIGDDAVAQSINIGTGAAARSISVGNAASTSITLDAISLSLDATTSSNFTITGNAAGDQTLLLSATNAGAGDGLIDLTADTVAISSAATIGGTLTVTGNSNLDNALIGGTYLSVFSGATGFYKVAGTSPLLVVRSGAVGNRTLCFTDYDNRNKDHGTSAETNPTFKGFSDLDPSAAGAAKWWSLTHDQANAVTGIGSGSKVTHHEAPVSIADEAEFDLPANSSGWGFVMAGDGEEYSQFTWTSGEVVTLISNSANVVNTDTDTNLCIFDNTGKVSIKNRLGAAKEIMFDYHYTT